jgi:hypothetical protein
MSSRDRSWGRWTEEFDGLAPEGEASLRIRAPLDGTPERPSEQTEGGGCKRPGQDVPALPKPNNAEYQQRQPGPRRRVPSGPCAGSRAIRRPLRQCPPSRRRPRLRSTHPMTGMNFRGFPQSISQPPQEQRAATGQRENQRQRGLVPVSAKRTDERHAPPAGSADLFFARRSPIASPSAKARRSRR